MYKIYADDTLIYDSTLDDYKIGKGSISLETNKSGSFTFSIYPDHFYYDNFVKMRTVIIVVKGSKIVFRGRILNDVIDYWNNKVITCEGELGFLQDSLIRPFTFNGTPKQLFTKFVNEHNAQVDEFKRFKIGDITVVDPNNYIVRANSAYETALENLNSRLIEDSLGGYFYITHGDEGNDPIPTLNYLADFTNISSQVIEFGSNLKDYTKTVQAETMATAIVPLGCTLESDSEEEVKLTIESVNKGVDYVYDANAVELYGWIFRVVEWEDVTKASILKTKAQEYLSEIVRQNVTIELKAIDLHLLDTEIESFSVGDYIRVTSKPHKFDDVLLCNKQTIDLLKPENDNLILGRTYSTLSGSSAKLSNSINNVTNSISSVSSKLSSKLTIINQAVDDLRIKVVESTDSNLEPDIYRVFGIVDELTVNLIPTNDNLIHEYCFEFIPSENFKGLTISPEIKWANTPQYPPGRTCQVSIVRNVGVLICA